MTFCIYIIAIFTYYIKTILSGHGFPILFLQLPLAFFCIFSYFINTGFCFFFILLCFLCLWNALCVIRSRIGWNRHR